MTFLTEPQRRTVFDKVLMLVDTKFAGAEIDVGRLREAHEARVVNSHTPEEFEQAVDGVLRDLKTSHTGLFHEARPRSAGRIAMAATLTKAVTARDGHRWVFQDVHPGGVAAAVGIESGDVLLAIDDQELVPPTAIPFRLGHSYMAMPPLLLSRIGTLVRQGARVDFSDRTAATNRVRQGADAR